MSKFFLRTVGCARRDFDAQKVRNYLIDNNFQQTDDLDGADLIVLSTCAFRAEKETQSVRLIDRCCRNRKAKIIVIGCLAKISPFVIEKYKEVVFLSPTTLFQIKDVLRLQKDFERFENPHFVDRAALTGSPSKERADLHLHNVRISTGCLGECAYCAVKYAVGRVQSRSVTEVLADFRAGLSLGHNRFLLVGDDVGCYGQDIGSNIRLLLKSIFEIDGDFKIVVKDFVPTWLIKYRLDLLLKKHLDKVEWVNLPFQSGSNRILRLMKRDYTIEDFEAHVRDLCELIPVTSAAIVGFPTETEEDFHATCDLVRRMGFAHVLIFPYSDRRGTESFDIFPKVPSDAIGLRFQFLKSVVDSSRRHSYFMRQYYGNQPRKLKFL